MTSKYPPPLKKRGDAGGAGDGLVTCYCVPCSTTWTWWWYQCGPIGETSAINCQTFNLFFFLPKIFINTKKKSDEILYIIFFFTIHFHFFSFPNNPGGGFFLSIYPHPSRPPGTRGYVSSVLSFLLGKTLSLLSLFFAAAHQ